MTTKNKEIELKKAFNCFVDAINSFTNEELEELDIEAIIYLKIRQEEKCNYLGVKSSLLESLNKIKTKILS